MGFSPWSFILLSCLKSVNLLIGTVRQSYLGTPPYRIGGCPASCRGVPRSKDFDKASFRCYDMPMLRGLFSGFIDLVYPKVCLVCKDSLKNKAAAAEMLCLACWQKTKKNLPPFCYRCGRHLGKPTLNKNLCPGCIKNPPAFDRAFAPCIYDGAVKELIQSFKYRGKDYLGAFLAKTMVEFIREYHLPLEYIDALIPVPLHPAKLREREFNQAETLGNAIAREFGKETLNTALIRKRNTKSQVDLKDAQRLLNVKGSFAVTDPVSICGKNLLLVDDVLTTAATCSEAAATLKDAGAKIVFVMTIAN